MVKIAIMKHKFQDLTRTNEYQKFANPVTVERLIQENSQHNRAHRWISPSRYKSLSNYSKISSWVVHDIDGVKNLNSNNHIACFLFFFLVLEYVPISLNFHFRKETCIFQIFTNLFLKKRVNFFLMFLCA